MHIRLNGEGVEVEAGMRVDGLLAHLGLGEKPVAVERNLAIVVSSKWGQTVLEEGDEVEIVHFVGGG